MSITAKVDALATAVGGDVDALRDRVGDPSTLATTEQTVIVDAINEVKTIADAAAGGGVSINDAATNTTQAWSSNKISNEITSATASLVDGGGDGDGDGFSSFSFSFSVSNVFFGYMF